MVQVATPMMMQGCLEGGHPQGIEGRGMAGLGRFGGVSGGLMPYAHGVFI
jgi:hypothetical protein